MSKILVSVISGPALCQQAIIIKSGPQIW